MPREDEIELPFTADELALIDRARARTGQSRRSFILGACLPLAEAIIVEQAHRRSATVHDFLGGAQGR